MNRTAHVALTPGGQSNVNRLRVPEFGVLKLALVAGSKASKSHLPEGAPAPKEADKGTDDFHFIPEKETIRIEYEIDNAQGGIETATLELFYRFRDAALWTLDLVKLGDDWTLHGKHVVKWDGRVVTPTTAQAGTKGKDGMEHDLTKLAADKNAVKDSFIDGYVTLEHTPYKLKLTLGSSKAQARTVTAWTYFQIVLKGIELELGPEEAVPATTVNDDRHKQDKAVRKRISTDGGLPTGSTPRRVYLISNLYKTNESQMNDNTAFTVYKDLWEEGPQIPIMAKIRLAASDDAEVKLDESDKGAVSLGKAKFLWDWEDPDEDVSSRQTAKPKAFLAAAIKYYNDGTDSTRTAKDHTYPKGDNCHVDRGGKRGPDGQAVFPDQDGYDAKDALEAGKFPFKVEPCKTRLWAAFSCGWTKGKLKGRTGILFQPSRMAGDDFKVTVYLTYEKTKVDEFIFDDKSEPIYADAKIKAATGPFQLWRELHLARYVRKRSAIADFVAANLASIQSGYRKAYVEVKDVRKADDTYAMSVHKKADRSAVDYNAIAEAALNTAGGIFTNHLASDAAANHANDAAAFKLRSYEDYVIALHVFLHGAFGADLTAGQARGLGTGNLSGLPADARKTRLVATQSQLVTDGTETRAKYSNLMTNAMPYTKLVNDLEMLSGGKSAAAADGLTILHFDYVHSVVKEAFSDGITLLQGVALDASDASRNRCIFVFFQADLGTFQHEVGHHLFLPHSRHHTGNTINPGGAQDDRHDDDDLKCIMSYSNDRTDFCGLCQLRLRGWDATKLKKDDADNSKP